VVTRHILPAIVIFAISFAIHAHARADAPATATECGNAATPGVAESPQCAERAAADQEHPSDMPSPPPRSRWYGWQTLAVDGASLGLIVLGYAAGSFGFAVVGELGLLLAAPIVHFAHGNILGLLSLGLRVASAALIVVGIGSTSDDEPNKSDALATAGLVGFGVTTVLDAALLSFEPRGASVVPYADAHGGFGLRMAWRL